MKVAVIGSREFDDYDKVKSTLDNIGFDIVTIVSGGARGADTLGEQYAIENEISTLIFIPEWNKYGKSAGYIRNVNIVKNADVVVAFWNGRSRGTKHSIDLAHRRGKEVQVIRV